MIGTTRSRVSFFMNRFRKLGFIEYNGRIRVNKSLLNVVLNDQASGHHAVSAPLTKATELFRCGWYDHKSRTDGRRVTNAASQHPRTGYMPRWGTKYPRDSASAMALSVTDHCTLSAIRASSG